MVRQFTFIIILSIVSLYADVMKSDEEHKKKEDSIAELSFDDLKKMKHDEAVRWLITPKLRLNKDDLQSLQKDVLPDVDGNRTIATLEAIKWNGKLSLFSNGPDILLEKVYYDSVKNSYVAIYKYPKNSENKDESIEMLLSDIKVKNPDTDVGKALIFLISHPGTNKDAVVPKSTSPQPVRVQPENTPSQQVSPVVVQQSAPPAQAPVVVQQPSSPQTVIIEDVNHPYPYPYVYGPGIVVGGWWGGHHHHRW